jgi:hypothetical protein
VYHCNAPECGKNFATEKNLKHDYYQDHPGEKTNRSVIPFGKLFQTLEFGGGHEKRIPQQESVEEADQRLSGKEIVQVKRCE